MPGDPWDILGTTIHKRIPLMDQHHLARRAKYELLAEVFEISLWARRDPKVEESMTDVLNSTKWKFKDTSSLLLRLLCLIQPLARDADADSDKLSDRARKNASRDLAAIYWAAQNHIEPAGLVDFFIGPNSGLEICAARWAEYKKHAAVMPKTLKVVPANAEVSLPSARIDGPSFASPDESADQAGLSAEGAGDDFGTTRPEFSGEAQTIAMSMSETGVNVPRIAWSLDGRNSYVNLRISPLSRKPQKLVAGIRRKNGLLYIDSVRPRRRSAGDTVRWVEANFDALYDVEGPAVAAETSHSTPVTSPSENIPILDWDGVGMANLKQFYDVVADKERPIYIEVIKSKSDLGARVLKYHQPSTADMNRIRKILKNK